MKNSRKKYVLVLLTLAAAVLAAGCAKGQGSQRVDRVPSIVGDTQDEESEPLQGVVKAVDEETQTMTVFSIGETVDLELRYSAGTRVYDRYGTETTMAAMEVGEIVDVYCDNGGSRITKISENKEAWEKEEVQNIEFDQTEQVIEMYQSKYRYTDDIVLADQGKPIDMIDINSQDELLVKGINKQIYSISISKGHGYLRPRNYKDFVGGMIEVGYDIFLPVTKNMLIPVKEGTYTVYMRNGNLTGEKTVKVLRGKEISMDMSEFKAEKIKEGYVTFDIRPLGADLYINGNLTDYDEPVKLKYGKHKITVMMTGYNSYNGTLDLQDKNPSISINLVDEVAEVGEETPAPTTSPAPLAGTDGQTEKTPASSTTPEAGTPYTSTVTEETESTSSPGGKVVDKDHTITITAPRGVEVYWNGTYKGQTPCTFVKEIGSHTLSLSEKGYQTKSYSVDISDDGKDITYSFADLVAE